MVNAISTKTIIFASAFYKKFIKETVSPKESLAEQKGIELW